MREATVEKAPQQHLSDLLWQMDGTFSGLMTEAREADRDRAILAAEAEWRAAIAAVAHLLQTLPRTSGELANGHGLDGISLSGPLPALNHIDFEYRLANWVVTPQPLADAFKGQHFLMPADKSLTLPSQALSMHLLPLRLESPLVTERFCLVVSPRFSVGLVLGQPAGDPPRLQYSFDPQVLLALWQHIQSQLVPTVQDAIEKLDHQITQGMSTPDYRLITQFSQAFIAHLPHRFSPSPLRFEERGSVRFTEPIVLPPPQAVSKPIAPPQPPSQDQTSLEEESAFATANADTELLQAMAHEIRTPLTTIRTLTRSLLRRKDISPEVKHRLGRIDQECTQQIDRFNLIFRAVELGSMKPDRSRSPLAPIALTQIFQEAIPRWQQQAQRRNLHLQVTLPPDLPTVTSDPTLINEVLTGVVEWFTQCLPPDTGVHMRVMLAGHQLKLQFEADPTPEDCTGQPGSLPRRPPLKSVGQLLTIAPETGSLSLNLDATKSLFEFLGGKLILRQRPEQGDVLTAFLPLDTREI